MAENRNHLKEGIENFINQCLGVNIIIKVALKINEKTCSIELESFEDNQNVMTNKLK